MVIVPMPLSVEACGCGNTAIGSGVVSQENTNDSEGSPSAPLEKTGMVLKMPLATAPKAEFAVLGVNATVVVMPAVVFVAVVPTIDQAPELVSASVDE